MASTAELFSLEGTVAIVTGATRGIGYASVQALASAGARTILTGLPGEHPEQVARALAAAGLPVDGIACDVTDDSQLKAVVEYAMGRYGRIDTVFCNAGVALDTGPHLESTDEQLDRMFDIHVRSVLHLANLALPHMADGGGGTFLVMSSLSGVRGNRMIGLYGVTKAANAQLARNLAVQWGNKNIRVNSIAPGVIKTEFATPITADERLAKARLAKTPLGRFGEPYHVAGTVVWLASKAGSFVSGQNIIIDGGTLASD